MLNEVIIRSPAKLNLHLKVHPIREDGYHDIESLFQAIDYCDELHVVKTDTKGFCHVEVSSITLPPENTLTIAYRAFCDYTGIDCGVFVNLNKKIPSGAGLGGGSSNGAALIKAMDMLFETKLSHEEKIHIATKVGSDVPFFISGGAAIVTGRGEFVRQMQARDDLFFVVIMPNVHSSTKDAFKSFDKSIDKEKTLKTITLAEVKDVYYKPVTDWVFINSFTDLLVNEYDCIGKALLCLEDAGAEYSQLSGSGSAVYGVFGNEEEAIKAYTTLSVEWTCCLTRAFL